MGENIFVLGAGKNGYRVKKLYELCFGRSINYFVDNDEGKHGCYLSNVEILSFEQMQGICKKSLDGSILLVAIMNPEEVVDQIRQSLSGVRVFVLSNKYKKCGFREVVSFFDAMCEIDYSLHRLEYLETHVANHCNLKCKGCGHFSNLTEPSFPSLEQFKSDISRLKLFFWGIRTFRLLGGEPLLNPKLPEFIKVVYDTFPDANVRVVTNGLLIPTISEDILHVMRDCCVGFDISLYPPTLEIKSIIELRCIENNIEYYFTDLIKSFYSRASDVQYKDPYITYNKCNSKRCHFLLDGKTSLCPSPVLRKKYSQYTTKKSFDEDIINIYDEDLTGEKLHYLMTHPNHQCGFCSDELIWFDWGNVNA